MIRTIRKIAFFTVFAISSVQLLFGQCTELIWADEFNGNNLDTNKWTALNDGSGSGNAELQFYTSRPENIKTENGLLIITALEEIYQGKDYTSARIETKYKGDWQFGRIEARMKLPFGQGMWPAFWMLPLEEIYGDWPNSGEIDIMEMVGNEPNTVYGTLHSGPPWEFTNGLYTLSDSSFSDAFHVFALDWNADTIKWFVDDSLYVYKTSESTDHWNIFQEKFYLIINLAVGGNWPGSPDNSTTFPQTLEVDYVRVYGDPSELYISRDKPVFANEQEIYFYVSEIPNASYTWSVPAGASIFSGQGTHSILASWGCTAGEISVDIQSICGSNTLTETIEFDTLAIAGDTLIYENDENLHYYTPLLKNTSYNWMVPDDAIIIQSDSNEMWVNWGCLEGMVQVEINNECQSSTISLPINIKAPSVMGPESVPEFAENIIYNIAPISNTQFTWTVPDGAEIINGQGTNEVSVNFGETEGYVGVELSNNCGVTTHTLPVSIGDAIIYCSFEGSILQFETFASTTFEMVENPYKEGINLSDHVGKSFKSEVAWAGIYTDLNSFIDFSSNNIFRLKVYGPKTGTVLFKIEDKEVGSTYMEVEAQLTQANQWQELNFDFTGAESGIYNRITLFFDFGSTTENTFYFDDIKLGVGSTSVPIMKDDEQDFKIYPNPVSGILKISNTKKFDAGTEIKILGLTGNEYLKERIPEKTNSHKIDTGFLKSGLYIIEVKTKDKTTFQKIMVSR